MTTTSTPEQNDPTADNRAEYAPPPCVVECVGDFDGDGLEVLHEGSPELDEDYVEEVV